MGTGEGEPFYTDWDETYQTFDEMDLNDGLLRGIYAYGGFLLEMKGIVFDTGFEKPSAIQQKGIVPFTRGFDVIQQAQSGTGKTATFCAGILNNLDYSLNQCQALVLAPTRELAQQIEKVMRSLGDYLQVTLFYLFVLIFPLGEMSRMRRRNKRPRGHENFGGGCFSRRRNSRTCF